MNWGDALLGVFVGLALAVGAYAVERELAKRPPIPDIVAEVEAVERRVEHVYLIHALTAAGTEGPWICEQANVGRSKPGGKR